MGGRYFAELVKGVFSDMEKDAFTYAENRISVYGKSPDEWARLAQWCACRQGGLCRCLNIGGGIGKGWTGVGGCG